ncbi:MAG: 16S rRNA (uracil(1498)-N(3))-methyltransferase, partial [bacterium]
ERPELESADAHHCCDVLRLGTGDTIVVFDGLGRVAEAELLQVNRKHCSLQIGSPAMTTEPRCTITLAQAVPKGKNMDLVLQKAVELGASSIVPLMTERTVVRLDEADAERKRERWQQIALESCKQCGRNTLPSVRQPCTVEQFLKIRTGGLLLLASLQPDSKPIKEVLAGYRQATGELPYNVTVLIGPEGDFTPTEIAHFKASDAIPVTLGPIILRTETAALYCLSVLAHELF